MPEDSAEDRARDSLLRSYSLKSVTHGTYIVTIAIGIFAFLQIVWPIEQGEIYEMLLASLVLPAFMVLGCIMLFQMVFWGMMISAVSYVSPIDEKDLPDYIKELERRREAKPTILCRLDVAANQHMKKYHRKISIFSGRWLKADMLSKLLYLWLGLYLVFLGLFRLFGVALLP